VFPLARKNKPPESQEAAKTSSAEWLEAFEHDFWKDYPHRVGKFEARKSWMKVKPWTQETCDEVFAGLARWNAFWQEQETDKRFIPYPATWLNQHRWEDEP
jgi:hypothetical protein